MLTIHQSHEDGNPPPMIMVRRRWQKNRVTVKSRQRFDFSIMRARRMALRMLPMRRVIASTSPALLLKDTNDAPNILPSSAVVPKSTLLIWKRVIREK